MRTRASNDPRPSPASRRRDWRWPLLVTGALLFTVVANVVMLVAAAGDPNGTVVEPDYYRKAIEWDRTLAARAASDRLGWHATATFRSVGAGHALVVEASDSSGAPVRGARFLAVLIHNRDAATPLRAVLEEVADGRYEAPVALSHAGLWEVRIEGRRDAERFTSTQRAEAARW